VNSRSKLLQFHSGSNYFFLLIPSTKNHRHNKMELKSDVQKALQYLTDELKVNDSTFKSIVDYAIRVILNNREESLSTAPSFLSSNNNNKDSLANNKSAFNAIIYLYLESAKHNYADIELTHFLEEFIDNAERVRPLCEKYVSVKDQIRERVLKKKTFGFPSWIDVDWRLDYVIKSSQVEKTNEPVYTLKLKCDTGEAVTISCTTEQLQDLYSKLRDAQKQIERSMVQ